MLKPISVPMSSPDITPEDIQSVRLCCIRPISASVLASLSSRSDSRPTPAPATQWAVSSGTAGLHLAIHAAGVGPGDLVVTTPFSFVSSANCILYERGVPVFVDIEPHTLNLDPAQVAQRG